MFIVKSLELEIARALYLNIVCIVSEYCKSIIEFIQIFKYFT